MSLIRGAFRVDAEGLTYLPVAGSQPVFALLLPDTTVPLEAAGDVLRAAVPTAAVLLSAQSTVILWGSRRSISTPESLYRLLDMAPTVARENGLQLFVTTLQYRGA